MNLNHDAAAAIAAAIQAAQPGSPLPAFGHVRLANSPAGFRAQGANGHIQVTSTAPALAGDDFDICVPADRLGKVMATARAEIGIAVSEKGLAMRCGASRFSLPLFPVEQFPVLPDEQREGEITLPAEMLRQALALVLPFAAVKNVRYMLEGMLVEVRDGEISFVASDGVGIAVLSRPLDGPDFSVLIPGSSCKRLKSLLGDGEVRLTGGRWARLTQAGTQVDLQLIDGKYVDYRRILAAEPPGRAVVLAGEALAVVSEAAIVAEADKVGAWVELDFGAEGIRVKSGGKESGGYEGLIACPPPSKPVRAFFGIAGLREIFGMFPRDAEVAIGYGPDKSSGLVPPFSFRSKALEGYRVLYMERTR